MSSLESLPGTTTILEPSGTAPMDVLLKNLNIYLLLWVYAQLCLDADVSD